MKVYECVTECYADDFRLYREGDRREVEDSYNHTTLDEKFKLIREDKPVKDDDPEREIVEGIKSLARDNGLKKVDLNKIYIAAGAVDNADRLKAVLDHIRG